MFGQLVFQKKQLLFEIFFKYSSKYLKENESTSTSVLEIASNDGTFLVPFKNKGYFTLGIDPAKNLKKYQLKNKIETIIDFFNKKIQLFLKRNMDCLILFLREM